MIVCSWKLKISWREYSYLISFVTSTTHLCVCESGRTDSYLYYMEDMSDKKSYIYRKRGPRRIIIQVQILIKIAYLQVRAVFGKLLQSHTRARAHTLYIYIYIYIYICISTHIPIYIYMCVCVYIYAYIYVCMYVCIDYGTQFNQNNIEKWTKGCILFF